MLPANTRFRDDSLNHLLDNAEATNKVDGTWNSISAEFERAIISNDQMARKNISFHDHVKLLGYLTLEKYYSPGDILEIGVWKGKSLTLMDRLSAENTKVIGIDPFEIPGQAEVVQQLHQQIYPSCHLIRNYSQIALTQTLDISDSYKIIHIDGIIDFRRRQA